jgi:hypothetical protein
MERETRRQVRQGEETIMKKLICGLLILGWIPTLVVVGAGRWVSGLPLLAQSRTPVKVTRIFTGPDGKTHVEE